MPAFSAPAIVLESILDQLRRKNVLGFIVQREVSPKLLHFLILSYLRSKMAYKASDSNKSNLTLGLLHLF
jgi:hypothetical protein